jgi:hypothetical protein
MKQPQWIKLEKIDDRLVVLKINLQRVLLKSLFDELVLLLFENIGNV